MKEMVLAALVVVAVAPAWGAETGAQNSMPPTMAMTITSDMKVTFELEPGGCLRGPLRFFSPDDGSVIFKLAAGAEYPVGCGTNPK